MMKKNYFLNNDDVDLIELLRAIWEKKLKIILIVFVLSLLSFAYYFKQPKSFDISLVIKPAQYKDLIIFSSINDAVNEFNYFNSLNSLSIKETTHIDEIITLDRFMSELMDYEELIFILEKNESVKKEISNLSKEDQKKKLYSYVNLLTFEQKGSKIKIHEYDLNFVWHDVQEGKKIIEELLKLTTINLEKLLFNDLENLQKVRKNQMTNKNLTQIEYLKEQAAISRSLNIQNETKIGTSIIDRDLFIKEILSFFNSDRFSNEALTFLKGSKAIEEEINIIQNRQNPSFIKFSKAIDDLKKVDVKWVNYNVNLIKTKSRNVIFKIFLIISMGISLIIAVIFVFLFNDFKLQKISRKK